MRWLIHLKYSGLLLGAAALAVGVPHDASAGIQVTSSPWGRTSEGTVEIYKLTNTHGVEARFITYGATLVSLTAPDRTGKLANIVLGFDSIEKYVAPGVPYYGATVGRYANRIAKARFTLDGKSYQLEANDGPNTLHGGKRGFDKRIWKAEEIPAAQGGGVRMTLVSADGEGGYPGELTAQVVYKLDDQNNLEIDYHATSTAPTPINLANHAYFNLTGDPTIPVLDHLVTINADRFTPVDATLIPSGELRPVAGTPFDFRAPHVIGARIGADDEQLRLGRGYDHNWVLNKTGSGMSLAATVTEPRSGRSLEVRTTQPGVQFYTGNFMDGKPSGAGTVYAYRTGMCFETQHFPDSPNHPAFPSTILRPGQVFSQKTVLSLRVVK